MTETDESGRVTIAPPTRVRDVLDAKPVTGKRGAMLEAAVDAALRERYEETRMECPRCGEDVFISLNAILPAPWRCEHCGAYGKVQDA